jgi:hypothetical protein
MRFFNKDDFNSFRFRYSNKYESIGELLSKMALGEIVAFDIANDVDSVLWHTVRARASECEHGMVTIEDGSVGLVERTA